MPLWIFGGSTFSSISGGRVSGFSKSPQWDFHRLHSRSVHFFLANQYLTNVKLARPWGFSEGGTHI
jgi:hypothetical protein